MGRATNSSSCANETVVTQVRLSDSSSVSSSSTEDEKLDSKIDISSDVNDDAKFIQNIKRRKISYKTNKIDKYQIELSLIALISLCLLNRFSIFQPFTSKFLHLQYKYPDSDRYDIGKDDIYIIITGMFAATFIRAFSMHYILKPLAKHNKIYSTKDKQRFMEQGWCIILYSTSFITGSYLYYHSPYFLNFDNFYIGWPHDQMSHLFKLYYVMSIASWAQQIFILNIEAKRKDHIQMFSHHIITVALVVGSYYYYFTRIGNVILVIMDVVDIFLSTAKLLKYCGFQTICDVMFGIFLTSWVILRHGIYNYIFYHAATKARDLMASGRCIEGIYQKRCFTDKIIDIFLSLLGGLQIITLIWMYFIAKVAIKVITGNGAEDVRSDDEEDDEDEDD